MSLREPVLSSVVTAPGWASIGSSSLMASLPRQAAIAQLNGVTYALGGGDDGTMVVSAPDCVNWNAITGANLPNRHYGAAATLNGVMYFSGGALKLNTGGWYECNDVFASSGGTIWAAARTPDWDPRMLHAMVAYDNKLWVLGGMSWDGIRKYNDVWSWTGDPNDRWEPVSGDTFSARNNMAAFSYGTQLCIIGGNTAGGQQFLGDGYYMTSDRKWQAMNPPPPGGPRSHGNVAVVGNAIYLGGGVCDQQGRIAPDYVFNGQSWNPVSGQVPWQRQSACAVYNGKVRAFGGQIGDIYEYTPPGSN
jgi:hypothetical protein